jgi:hypothetical protein
MALDKIIVEYLLDKKKFDQQTKDIEKQLEGTEKAAKDATKGVSGEMDKLGSVVGKIGGFISAAFVVERVVAFGKELIEVRKQAEGVERAFAKIPESERVLRDLQKATRGTVSELKLMQTAVKAKNFKIPLERLGSLLQFAQIRARETGESVDFLVDSIINGVSRKSLPILDNLGLSMNEIRGEMKKTGDMGEAVFTIVNRELELAGGAADLLADKTDRNTASFEDLKRTLSVGLAPGASRLSDIFGQLISRLNEMAEVIVDTDQAIKGDSFLSQVKKDAKDLTAPEIKDKIEDLFDIIQQVAQNGGEADNKFLKDMNAAIKIYQSQLERLTGTIDDVAIVSIATLNAEIKTLQDRINNAQIGSFEFEQATAQLSAKQEKLNQIMLRYTALLNVRKNLEEDLSESDDVDLGLDSDGNIPGLLSKDQEDDLIAETKRIQGRLRESWNQFNDEQEEANTKFFETNAASMVNRSSEFVSTFSEFASNIAQIQINSLTKQLQDGQITQEEFDRRRIQIMREQAIREKAFNLFGAITNTAVAITAALKEGPIKAALVGALGAAQIAAIASQPLPAFKEGVIDLEGKGTGTSDENLAWLSRGESVITAKQTAKHKDALQAIHRDRFDQYITEAIAAKEMAKSQSLSESDAAAMAMISSAGVDSVGLIHAIQSSANKRNRNENKNAEYIASRISRSIAREGYYRNRYS